MRLTFQSTAAVFLLSPLLFGCGGSGPSLLGLPGTPVLTGVTPNPAAAGSTVTVTGTNLAATSVTAFLGLSTGGVATPIAAVPVDSASVTVTLPTTMVAGTYKLTVQTADGSSFVSPISNNLQLGVN